MSTEGHLQIQGLRFAYHTRPVLRGIDLAVGRGEILAVIGPNGAGKSTFLKCLNRRLRPLGSVLLDEADTARMDRRALASHFALIPQDSEAAFSFTALEVVLMGRYPRGSSFGPERARDLAAAHRALALAGAHPLADKPFCEMSGGERQKVLIARALCQDPAVLLCDEPTLHLDVRNQVEILALLRALARSRGLTIVFVCHDLNLSVQFGDRFALLLDGRLFALGGREVLSPENVQAVMGVRPTVLDDGQFPVFRYRLPDA
jgi:iron complex transport system ATP-binding protein